MDRNIAVSLVTLSQARNDAKAAPINKHIAVHGVKTNENWNQLHSFYVSKGLA